MKQNIKDIFSVLANTRHRVAFLLLLRQNAYVTSGELAAEMNVSTRTVKSDLSRMKELLADFDIWIISQQGKGYLLQITDEERNREIKEHFQIYQPTTVDDNMNLQIQYIIRRLLISQEPIKAEALQRELFINESNSLYKELAAVKAHLEDYRLELISRPHYGMTIAGEEIYKIICTIRMYRYFHKNTYQDFRDSHFHQLFQCDEEIKESIRQTLFKTLTGSRIVFSDIYAERFVMYFIYFRNKYEREEAFCLKLPRLSFDYKITDEYQIVIETIEKLRNRHSGFQFGEDVYGFLTLIAIMSTDLYRFRDCVPEKYGDLVYLSEKIRNYMIDGFSRYLNMNAYDDYVCMKDLLKVMLPVSLKVELGISDDVDLGFHDLEMMEKKPLLRCYVRKLCDDFYEKYHYRMSDRERYLIFTIFLGLINRITLSHTKLKLGIIAIDGRLSTQQLKFNLQHYFNDFIERIEIKVLYELESMDYLDYDYYLCMDYGRYMNISYHPIYYAKEGLTESEYEASLNTIFFDSYGYDKVLPKLQLIQIDESYRYGIFRIEEYLTKDKEYTNIITGKSRDIQLYLNLYGKEESIRIFYFANQDNITLYGEKYFIIVDICPDGSRQKLKMLLNVIDQISGNPDLLRRQCQNGYASYKHFFCE